LLLHGITLGSSLVYFQLRQLGKRIGTLVKGAADTCPLLNWPKLNAAGRYNCGVSLHLNRTLALVTFYDDASRVRGVRQTAGKLSGKVPIYYAVDFYEESVTVAEWAQAVIKGDISSIQSSSEKPQFSLGLLWFCHLYRFNCFLTATYRR